MQSIPAHKAEIIRSATRALNQAVRGLAQSIILTNTVHEYYEVHGLQQYYPTKDIDPESGRTVSLVEVYDEEGTYTHSEMRYEDDETLFEGEAETVVDPDAPMPFADKGLSAGEYIEMGDFIASLTFYALGNCYEAPDGTKDEALTAFGRPPLSHEKMHEIRRKYSL